jgi:hypothetical protein
MVHQRSDFERHHDRSTYLTTGVHAESSKHWFLPDVLQMLVKRHLYYKINVLKCLWIENLGLIGGARARVSDLGIDVLRGAEGKNMANDAQYGRISFTSESAPGVERLEPRVLERCWGDTKVHFVAKTISFPLPLYYPPSDV